MWSIPGSLLYPLDLLMARHTTCVVRSIAYCRAYVWSIGDDLRPFSLFCCGQVLSLTQYSHLVTQPRTPSLLIYFELFQNHVKVCVLWKYHQASWSISIDLDAQCVSSFIQVFLWKTPFKQPFMLSRNFTSFRINNMSFTYTYQKCCSAPTHFIVNTSF